MLDMWNPNISHEIAAGNQAKGKYQDLSSLNITVWVSSNAQPAKGIDKVMARHVGEKWDFQVILHLWTSARQ